VPNLSHISKSNHLPPAEINMQMPLQCLLCAAAVVVLTGCGGPSAAVAPVSGRVTLDGQPLSFAIVTFQPEGKSSATGGTDKNGNYELMYKRGVMGSLIGASRVTILLNVEQAHRPQLGPTDLQREVKAGPNVFNFDLKSASKQ
jgi:hypothetical protein